MALPARGMHSSMSTFRAAFAASAVSASALLAPTRFLPRRILKRPRCVACQPYRPACMSGRPPWQRGRSHPPPPPPPSMKDMGAVFEKVRDTWRGSTPGEKLVFAAAAGVAGLAAGSVLNTVLSFAVLAVFGVFALPVLAVAGSMGIATIALATAGFAAFSVLSMVGFGFVGVPFLVAGSVLFKVGGPLLVAAPAVAWKRRRDVRLEAERERTRASVVDENDYSDETGHQEQEDDFFSQFDQKLADRGVSSGSSFGNTSVAWSVRECAASLRAIGMHEAATIIARERIDGHVLSMMRDSEVQDLARGLPFGDRKRLTAFARQFRRMK